MKTYVKVRIESIKFEQIPVRTGLRLSLLPILFNIALKKDNRNGQ